MDESSLSPVAAIFRHQLFLPSERFIKDQATSMRRFQPVFVARDMIQGDDSGATTVSLALHARGLDLMRYKLLRSAPLLSGLISEHRPRLIHAHFGVEGVYALPVAERLQVPLITTFHGFDVSMSRMSLCASRRPSWINYAAHRTALAHRGTLFVCVSDHVRERVVRLGFPTRRLVRHYIGVDTKRFRPGMTDRPPRILHVARLVEVKGTADLIRAFQHISHIQPDTHLDIVGDGPLAAPLMSLTRDLGLAARVHFHGTRQHDEIADLMRNSAVFCLPSKRTSAGAEEGLGMVLLEAAASATPVVATRHGGIPEAVEHGISGLLVDEGETAQLADALLQVLRDNRFATDLGAGGRRRVLQHFDLARQTTHLEKLYESVL